MNIQKKAFYTALPHTLPILAGFLFLGISYGFFMTSKGFSPVYPIFMSILIYAGSMEFITVGLLMSSFNPAAAFLLAITVNARHLFYGISLLDKYKNTGKKKLYLIFGMCDESFVINYTVKIPSDTDKSWFMVFVTALNHLYWAVGAALGAIRGKYFQINTQGLDFILAALFIVIMLEQWLNQSDHVPAMSGLIISIICLLIFGDNFIIPAMILMVFALLMLKKYNEVRTNAVN
ncbi:AzlC family ABC transporter permease [Pectinatus haikarae]|uniref:AzlC family ABC transporter permease n=1 Tax=Pectinatus haikarae TaxID=349096 RepID=UPI0018C80DAC|nr:AzlC family ABC transporter permease [Pectinatus haikarae]